MKINYFTKMKAVCQLLAPSCTDNCTSKNPSLQKSTFFTLIILSLLVYHQSFCQDSSSHYNTNYGYEITANPAEVGEHNFQSYQANFMKSKVISPDNDLGTLPKEIKYDQINNKYFVYGDQKILVFDAKYEFIDDIEISKHGHAMPWARSVVQATYKASFGNYYDFRDDRMVFDGEIDNILYCVTEDLTFLVINSADNTIEYACDFESYNSTALEDFGTAFFNCQVIYNHRNNKVWWIINDWKSLGIETGLRAKVFEYDPSDQTISEVYSEAASNIPHLMIHPTRDIYYVSLLCPTVITQQVKSKVLIYNLMDHQIIRAVEIDTYNDGVFFIHHFDYIGNEVFCYPYHKTKPYGDDEDYSEIFRIDGIDDYAEIKKSVIQLVFKVTCSFYNQETNKLYLGYHHDFYYPSAYQEGINLYEYDPDDEYLGLQYSVMLSSKPLKFVKNQEDEIIYCGLINNICGFVNEIELFYCGNGPGYFANNHIMDIFYDDFHQKVMGINFMSGSIEVLNSTDLSPYQSIYTGSYMHKGIYSPVTDECYFFNQNDMTNNKMGILNNNTNSLSFENYNDRIQKVEYDFINNALYIAKKDKILIYDVLNHVFLEEEIIIPNTEILLDMGYLHRKINYPFC